MVFSPGGGEWGQSVWGIWAVLSSSRWKETVSVVGGFGPDGLQPVQNVCVQGGRDQTQPFHHASVSWRSSQPSLKNK